MNVPAAHVHHHHHHHLSDVFSSLQGEGRNSGRPCTFVRYATCNLACRWCDTKKKEKYAFSTFDLMRKIASLGNRSVILTGGEPTIQPGLDALVDALKKEGYWVALETNGLKAPNEPERFDYVSVSPKSAYVRRYLEDAMLRKADEVRIVAVQEELAPFCRRMRELIAARDYYVSPLEEDGRIHYRRAFHVLKQLNKLDPLLSPPWALSIQMHKVLGIK